MLHLSVTEIYFLLLCESVKRAGSDVPALSADHTQELHLICTSPLIWKLAQFSFLFRKDSVNTALHLTFTISG